MTATATQREKIIERIRKLRAVAAANSGATDSERAAALATIKSLLDKYSITQDETEKPDVKFKKQEVLITYEEESEAIKSEWLDFFLAGFCTYLNCTSLTYRTRDKILAGYQIIGQELDAEVCIEMLQELLPVILPRGKQLYDKACDVFTQIKSGASNQQIRNTWFVINSSSNSYSYNNNFSTFINLDFGEDILNILSHELHRFDEMPKRTDDSWVRIENDWGLGFASRIIQKLNEQEADVEMIEGEIGEQNLPSNVSLVRTSTALVVNAQQIRDSKLALNAEFIKQEYKNINIDKMRRLDIQNQALFNQGYTEAQDVEVKARK